MFTSRSVPPSMGQPACPTPGVVPPGRSLHDDAVALDARDERVAVGERPDAPDLAAAVRGELREAPERGVPERQTPSVTVTWSLSSGIQGRSACRPSIET
jgi:hypothetical protein